MTGASKFGARFLRRCIDLGLGQETFLLLIQALEHSRLGEEIGHAIFDGLENGRRTEEAPEFCRQFAESLLAREPICRVIRPRENSSVPSELRRPPCGPRERWGYEGPVTPRLSERDWWPLRNAVIQEADWTCHYCGDRHDYMCADHVVPLSRGGTNERDNLVCSCVPCNSSKADRLLSEWKGRYR